MDYKIIKTGLAVKSRCGRDKDTMYIVAAEVNEDFVLLADGGRRPLGNPKLKRRKHCKPICAAGENTFVFYTSKKPEDTEIKKFLKDLKLKENPKEVKYAQR